MRMVLDQEAEVVDAVVEEGVAVDVVAEVVASLGPEAMATMATEN